MNRDLINRLFEKEFNKEIVVDFPWKQKFLTELPDGSMEIRRILQNIVRIKLHKEKTSNRRFVSIIPKYGVEFIASLSNNIQEQPVILDSISHKGVGLTSLENMSSSEVIYFIEKFIKGVI